ncbi:DUF3570 domain-containing protein [Thalassotalea sp. M1531]|uniref:DUF3570 domain-containing protein n=1 Tax=Thalassotalea algicola TaxID=2716224 RepID=A0A7Y0L9S1_9GAMM|nr:DUF3570 domain-containing protein [Thalassotalea algicola]NMP30583.1 DUF3570 domain-containing protein [Thalassotalea algicola]
MLTFTGQAAVLEPDRADVLYHSYEGGGMTIDGPAVLLRKKASESVAVTAYYYLDTISSASVDVVSTASPYREERHEGQLGVEYLNDKTLMSLNLRKSDEDDYLAQSFSVNVSQDTFGDLTNLSLGFSYGDNEIKRNGDDNFEEQSEQYRVRAGINQILTSKLVANLSIEAVADKGYLNNPYRTVRFVDSSIPSGVGYQAEVYPETRNSFATKLSASYYLPYRAALLFHYRYFSDSWEIDASDIEIGYRHPIGDNIELEVKARYYQQSQAEFYSDLFPYQDAQNYLARDKELSDFDDITLGVGVTYLLPESLSIGDTRSEATLQWDYIDFNYNNFRDATADAGIGEEPLYGFSANVIRAFISIYF